MSHSIAGRWAGAALAGLTGWAVAADLWLWSVPALPAVDGEAREFATAAMNYSGDFVKESRLLLRKRRVVSLVVDDGPADGGCPVCYRGESRVGCVHRYRARVRFYTWFAVPYTAIDVTCTGAARTHWWPAKE